MMKNVLIVVAAILVFAGAFILKNSSDNESAPVKKSEQSEVAALPRLVDLGSDKCIPCKKMAPILENLAQEHQESFVVANDAQDQVRHRPGRARNSGHLCTAGA